jgi:metal-responsive CopG/Arc/MetJ family transcriptional regulator
MRITLNENLSEELEIFSQKLNISKEEIISKALEDYFDKASKNIVEQEIEEYNKDTKLSFNEFWDDVDI